jgi:single-stranded-DNA-specific exonuclease
VEETAHAKEIGIDMVITDHHECKHEALPGAVAIVDCKQDGDNYPNKNLAGVGVALKLVCACEGDSKAPLEKYADLVAIGTVADVMPLIDENRFLVKYGLEKLKRTPRPGISAMFRESSVDPAKLNASVIGYTLAPRINAAGRLGNASIAAKLLMSKDELTATNLAVELCDLNRQRQNIEMEIWQEANQLLSGKSPEAPIVLASDKWHQGVIGIAASRLAEQYSLPTIMICLNGDVGKGSCRSYGGFNLFDALSFCSEYLMGFGGHALAAGLNIKKENLPAFRAALAEYYRKNKPEKLPEIQCDLLINRPELLSIENVRSLDLLEPYGNCNPKPVMCISGARLESAALVGNGRHLRVRLGFGGEHFEGIFFSHTLEELGLREGESVDVAFNPQINEYRGNVSVQLVISAMRSHEPSALCSAILEKDESALWAASEYCPQRADFVQLWRSIPEDFSVGNDIATVIGQCLNGMAPERYCLCLMTLLETGLLQSADGQVFSAKRCQISGKADLEGTKLMQLLHSYIAS